MRFFILSTIVAVAAAAGASTADVQKVRTILQNVTSATNELTGIINTYTSDKLVSLTQKSIGLVTILDDGAAAINPIQGEISFAQSSSYLIDAVTDLNTATAGATSGIVRLRPTLKSAGVDTVVLSQLTEQLQGAEWLRGNISLKFSESNKIIATRISQPSIDSLEKAIAVYNGSTNATSGASNLRFDLWAAVAAVGVAAVL